MIAALLFGLAGIALVLAFVQTIALRAHLRAPTPRAGRLPGMSVLKPLCGVDDALAANLRSFASLDYPEYEVLLGVRDASDPAYEVARAAAARWPDRFRVVVQRGAPGLNPKVNQLITLEAAARHEVVVVSDSNVRVHRGYLREIAAHLADPFVALVTHPVAGAGERSAGALLDNLQLSTSIAPGVAAMKRLALRDIVVGKSMALWRGDLRALGGFQRLKDVLAEDFVSGVLVRDELGRRVALARTPVLNVTHEQSVRRYAGRYLRWSVMQRRIVGSGLYGTQVLLHPLLLALAAFAARPERGSFALVVATVAAKAAADEWSARLVRGGGLGLAMLLWSPLKDACATGTWLAGWMTDEICWRGTRLRVLEGTVLAEIQGEPDAASVLGRAA